MKKYVIGIALSVCGVASAADVILQAGKAVEALAMIDDQALEADQRVWLASQMSSTTRAALKKAKIIPTA